MDFSLLFGILVFAYGCFGGGDMMQYIGGAFIFAGLIGLFEKIWPEEEEELEEKKKLEASKIETGQTDL